jgi:membrane protease subunit HflC
MRILLLLIVVLVGGLLLSSSAFTVDRTEFVYLTQFGRPVATFDGANADEAGLHWKWPWPVQSAQRLDRRLQAFDLPAAELLTHDRNGRTIDRTLTLDAYVCWRIADKDGVDRFLKTVGTPERARALIGQRLGSELGAAIGQMELDDLLSTEAGRVDRQREAVRKRLLESWGVDRDYGIELVDVRLRRASHPQQVQQAIFDRIASERATKVAEYESQGKKQAAAIASDAEARKREILAAAETEERTIKGHADVEADRLRHEAFSKDPEFYAFLKKLEEYQRILGDGKSMLLLSSHRELFDLLFEPPKPGAAMEKPKGAGVGGKQP